MSRLLSVSVILTACAFFLGHYIGKSSQQSAPNLPEPIYDTSGTSKSLFAGSQAYFSADQSPGKVSVKPMSAFDKMIKETCVDLNHQVTSVTPLGPGVMVKGEMCYGAVHITFKPIPVSGGQKKSF